MFMKIIFKISHMNYCFYISCDMKPHDTKRSVTTQKIKIKNDIKA